MKAGKSDRCVLVVSSSDKVFEYLSEFLSPGEFSPILRARSAGEAKRMLLSSPVDIVIINTPLSDEFGTELALDISDGIFGILLLVKSDFYEQTCYKVEDSGVLTLQKPNTRQNIYGGIKLLSAMSAKLSIMEKRNQTLKDKMADIRTVNRAKWLLIENLNMTENEAHYYIEKKAMDSRISRREAAENVIRTYDK